MKGVPRKFSKKINMKYSSSVLSVSFNKSVFTRPYSPRAQMPDSQLCVQRRETYRQTRETVNNKPVLPLRGV